MFAKIINQVNEKWKMKTEFEVYKLDAEIKTIAVR